MIKFLVIALIAVSAQAFCGPNQTDELSVIQPPNTLPFRINIVKADFQLPSDNLESFGLQAFLYAVHKGKALLLAGRTNGLHGFGPTDDTFTVRGQNTVVYVIDPDNKKVAFKSLHDPSSHLTQAQIDTLSVTAGQSHQVNNTMYMVGGYGVDTATGQFSTKSTLTAIDVPGLMHWVEKASPGETAAQYIRETSHPLLQVTGGFLSQANPHEPFLLFFGQNFTGFYSTSSNGAYTKQVRPFRIIDNGKALYVQPEKQFAPNPNYRRRDLVVTPIIQKTATSYAQAFVALSGVFTEESGIWTVPILINAKGGSFMPDPLNPNTFKQGMNSYDAARAGLFSKKTNEMFVLVFGGISYLSFVDGSFVPDPEIPFINSVTTIKIDGQGNFTQYLMENEFPVIPADFANFGNPLLFGAEARFIPAKNLPAFSNNVFSLDELGSSPILLGYIVGGIQSTVPNTSSNADSAASPYIFNVMLEKR